MSANSAGRRIPELCFALREAGVVVAGAARALAVAFAARRGGAAGGTTRVVAVGWSWCRDHRADVRDRRVGNRPDAETRHAVAVVGPHSHRFRQGRICAGGAGRIADRGCDRLAGLARHPALAVAWSRNAAAVHFLRGRRVQSGHRSAEILRRPRPAVCRRRGQRLSLLALRGQPGLLQLSVRPRHDRLCAGLRRVGRLAPGARCDGRLCHRSLRRPVWCCWPIIRATWSPARWSGSSARCSCDTGLRPAGSDLRSSATAALCPLSGPRPGASKGLPAALSPHKSGRRLTARYARFRVLPNQPDECRFDTFRHRCGRRFHRCAGAQRSGERRAAGCGNRRRARRPLGLRDHLCQ